MSRELRHQRTGALRAEPLRREDGGVDFGALRRREFSRLDRVGEAYLDWTGTALYAESQIRAHEAMLRRAVLGNPHSESGPSRASTAIVEAARARVLAFFRGDPREWTVCFTANASGAIRIVAESYPFARGSQLVLAADNHNSVNGIREHAAARGAEVRYLPLDGELRLLRPEAHLLSARPARNGEGPSLFAFPAQSNFSGVRHPLALARHARALGYDVLVDAAAFAPTSELRLDGLDADFVALSFYKMFGFPTGVGALLARRGALARLRRPWFAGGTVDFVSTQSRTHQLRAGPEGFEDGTPNFLSIAALDAGFTLLESVGMARLHDRVDALGALLLERLLEIRHSCGRPMVAVHGPTTTAARGATVAFNVVDAAGSVVPYALVEERARMARVSVRGGCFCNPGASEHAFGFEPEATRRCLEEASRDAFTIARFARCMRGKAVGAVRASLGMASDERDIARLVEVVEGMRGCRVG
jgi:selenocysteine lyase/cysteine desulfurase